MTINLFTEFSTVGEVIHDKVFSSYGRLLFPVDRPIREDMTLRQVSNSDIYLWYANIHPEKTVEILNYLKQEALSGKQIFYPIYSEEEQEADPSKKDTGIFFFRGNPYEKTAIISAGGGFVYVGAMHDSFPHALELSRKGINAFAIIYRPDDPYNDLAHAIAYVHDHAEELQVDPNGYSLWGGSAGARMSASLGNADVLYELTGRSDLPQAAAVIMQYSGYSYVSQQDAPTYANAGTGDRVAYWSMMPKRLAYLQTLGIPAEFHSYDGLPHGYGIGTGTSAEGWIDDALRFWKEQIR